MTASATATRLLVIGATGILAPLARDTRAEGATVTGVARSAAGPGGVAADTTTDAGARAVTAAGPFGQAVVYGPTVTDATLAVLLEAVHGRAVLVLTSSAADPARVDDPSDVFTARRPRPGDGVVVLGWTPDGRWHSPAEVSAAARDALVGGEDAILGVLRPWSDRP